MEGTQEVSFSSCTYSIALFFYPPFSADGSRRSTIDHLQPLVMASLFSYSFEPSMF
jgi:hypothetical protein